MAAPDSISASFFSSWSAQPTAALDMNFCAHVLSLQARHSDALMASSLPDFCGLCARYQPMMIERSVAGGGGGTQHETRMLQLWLRMAPGEEYDATAQILLTISMPAGESGVCGSGGHPRGLTLGVHGPLAGTTRPTWAVAAA
eukprot:CAMPEP_0180153788 /NCGR_PEP_ID=MMETSP0986-20121125/23756_1 /TAXON_ID=697907 /ORGANISM="non described non described, Strain CCMP2293" /LENGTH=142 /DNA_ID=CAMNT_0022101987 /DNA_START=110 /DNA_END=535 /DNA_ORIENTATION=-